MLEIVALFAWGAGGAFIYAANALIFGLWNNREDPGAKTRAILEFGVAIVTGAISAGGLTGPLVAMLDAGITISGFHFRLDPDRIATALTIGWVSNYLWPRLLKKIGARVDALGEGNVG